MTRLPPASSSCPAPPTPRRRPGRRFAWRGGPLILGLLLAILGWGAPAATCTAGEAPAPPSAEEPEPPRPPLLYDLAPVVVRGTRIEVSTPARHRMQELEVPRAVSVVTQERIVRRAAVNALDALDDQPGVWVEKRTAHTSDLVVRGLSGANLLALVDGNTLSTFWGEGGFAGDDMYGKINPDNVARIEVVRGPSSVLYGSNALGAVVNFITKESPFGFTECGTRLGATTLLLGGTSPSGWRVHQEVYGATERLRWFVGGTRLDYGHTEDGEGQEQSPTSARGWYGDVALNWKISPDAYAKFTVQVADLDPTHRYYRPTQSNENRRIAVAGWIDLPNLGRRTALADSLRLGLYYQDKRDVRHWYDALTGDETKWGEARWQTVQVDLQARKALGCHQFTYGVEIESTDGESPDDEQFTMHLPGGVVAKDAPDSRWSSLGAYLQDEWQVAPRLTLTGAVRVDLLRLATDVDAKYTPPGGLDPEADEFTDTETAIVGGLHASYALSPTTRAFGGWTRGFRQFAPKFGVTQTGFGVVVPNQLLTPITADQFEVGVKHRGRHSSFEVVAYWTRFRNFQNLVRGTFAGLDWYDHDGDLVRDPGEDVYRNVGNGRADLYGVELAGSLNLAALDCRCFGEAWTVGGSFAWNHGQDETNDIPLRHTQPLAAAAWLRWEPPGARGRPWAEVLARFADRFDRIPPDRLANDVGYWEDPQDPGSGKRRDWGLPGYTVVDLRAGARLGERVEVSAGVGNLFDKLYRPAHARWDAPGRNFSFAISVTW